jgi:molybdate-binding protein/transcriptional regulator with XRE-family HTH domain
MVAYHKESGSRVKNRRLSKGWSQAELALRAGISRTAVTAIELNQLVPSVAAALALAQALDCSVEDLFGPAQGAGAATSWAWLPRSDSSRFWHARVPSGIRLYPVEATAFCPTEHDGIFSQGAFNTRARTRPEETLVLATCDPAASLLAAEYARLTGYRLLVVQRSGGRALDLLAEGLVHVAGIHFGAAGEEQNETRARARLNGQFILLRSAVWEEGLALTPGAAPRSLNAVLRARLSWVGREPGSSAQQCLDTLLAGRKGPRRVADGHRGVAEAVRSGWADVGVCLRLASDEAGLHFLPVREEAYELCYSQRDETDPRIRALVRLVRSQSYRRLVAELPGYDSSQTGEARPVQCGSSSRLPASRSDA